MIYELYFSNISKERWDILAEQSTGGLGNIVYDLINKIEKFKKKYKSTTSAQISNFVKSLGFQEYTAGTQRSVFSIDDDHVIKIAWNSNGIIANKKESNPKVQGLFKNMLPRVYQADPGGEWVVMEKVIGASDISKVGMFPDQAMEKWYADIGFPESIDWSEINNAMYMIYKHVDIDKMEMGDAIEKSINQYNWTEEQKRDLLESRIFSTLVRSISEFGKEFLRVFADINPNNIGWSVDGDPVILDWG